MQIAMVFTKEDIMLIKVLRQSKSYSARKLLEEFPDKDWSRSALDRLLRQIDATGSADRKSGSGRRHTVCTRDYTDDVELLVVSQEDAPGTHRTIRQVARETSISKTSVHRIIQKEPETSVFYEEKGPGTDRSKQNQASCLLKAAA